MDTLGATLQVINNAKSYEIDNSTDGTNWSHAVTSSKSRGIVVPNLKPGTMYYPRARAVGGSTGYGNRSDPRPTHGHLTVGNKACQPPPLV
jgi:hypothetical protein